MKKSMAKVLASALSLAMAVTLVTPSDAAAATAPKFAKTYGKLYSNAVYTVKNVKKGYKVKITVSGDAKSAVKATKSGKAVTTIKATGKTVKFTAAVKASAKTANKGATVTATVYNTKGKKVKTLKDGIRVMAHTTKVAVSAPETAKVDEEVQVKTTLTPAYSTDAVKYTVDSADATVSSKGVFKASKAGTYVVTATSNGKSATATISIEKDTMSLTAKQTGTKTIEVTGTKAFVSPSAITVKKGSVTVALAEKNGIAVGSDGKTLVLTTASKMTAGDYTISASKTDNEATATLTAADEKIEKIDFLSDKAVLNAKATTGSIYTTAYVTYKVYNQFGEDVTKDANSSIEVNGSEAKADGAGKVTFTRNTGYNLNDVVAAVVIYKNGTNVVSQTGTFKVSSEAVVDQITIKEGVYNKDGKTLTEDSKLTDGYYVLATAKDQYGNDISLNTNNVILQFVGGITNLEATSGFQKDKITVDGVDYNAIKLSNTKALSAGSATALIVSKGTGKTAQTTINVANGSKIDKITLQLPDLIVGGEETEIGYTALDSYGKEVTSVDALTACTGIDNTKPTSGNSGLYAKEDAVTGKAKLYYVAKDNKTSVNNIDVITIMTKTYQASTVQFTIRPNAVATAIVGTKDLTTGVLSGQDFKLKKNHIVVQDQYGRSGKVADANFKVYVTPVDASPASEVFNNVSSVTNKELIKDTELTGTKAKTVTETKSAKLKFTLFADKNYGAALKEVSSYEVTFTVAPRADIKSYEVADLGTMYYKSTSASIYMKEVDVKGVLADGTKVKIPNDGTRYNLTFSSGDISEVVTGKVGATTDLTATGKALEKSETATYTVTVTINATGEKFKKELVVSKAAPKAVSVAFNNDKDHFAVTTGTVDQQELLKDLKIKDQYGVEYKKDTA